jgi:hypothetical protein
MLTGCALPLAPALSLAAAYPDRLAVRADRSNRRVSFTLAGGSTVRLPHEEDPLGQVGEAGQVVYEGESVRRS